MPLIYGHHASFWSKNCPKSHIGLAKGGFLCTPESLSKSATDVYSFSHIFNLNLFHLTECTVFSLVLISLLPDPVRQLPFHSRPTNEMLSGRQGRVRDKAFIMHACTYTWAMCEKLLQSRELAVVIMKEKGYDYSLACSPSLRLLQRCQCLNTLYAWLLADILLKV